MFGGTEEFWTHGPVSHRKSLGGRQGEEDNVRIQLILFQSTLFVLNLILLGLPRGVAEVPKYLNISLNMVKVYFKTSYVTLLFSRLPPKICCAPAIEAALIHITKEGLAVLRKSPNTVCPRVPGRADLYRSWK